MELEKLSQDRLIGVEPRLAACVTNLARVLPYPIRVICGRRTREEQVVLFNAGKSKTMNSKHLPQPDGYSHAVDIVAMINSAPDWDFYRFCEIAERMRFVAGTLSVTWGAIWDTPLNEIAGSIPDAFASYSYRFKQRYGRASFVDSDHFQIK